MELKGLKEPKERTILAILISSFENRKITILDSIVIYLRENGMNFNEIFDMLNRDRANIWHNYSRSIKRLEDKEIKVISETKTELIPVLIPSTIFSDKLGILESLTKYLKENLKLTYSEISQLLNRDQRTIWTSYNKAISKQKSKLRVRKTEVFLPVTIFNKKQTTLESIVEYLRTNDFTFNKIARLLNRNRANIYHNYSSQLFKD